MISQEDELECKGWNNCHTSEEGQKFYKSCTVSQRNGTPLNIGIHDVGRVMMDDDDDSTSICQILAIFEDVYEEMWIEVRWFELMADLIPRTKKMRRLVEQYEGEVVETEDVDIVSPGAIIELVNLVKDPAQKNEKKASEWNLDASRAGQKATIVCRYLQTDDDQTLVPVGREGMSERGFRLSSFQLAYSDKKSSEKGGQTTLSMADVDTLGVDPYLLAIRRLHLSVVPQEVPCRESEKEKVMDAVRTCITQEHGNCPIYISGMPGTGKTATVLASIEALQRQEVEKGTLEDFDFLEINCLRLQSPQEAYTSLWAHISNAGVRTSSKVAANRLNGHFNQAQLQKSYATRRFTVCLVDEIDYLYTKSQNVVYDFFNWPLLLRSKLIVIGIANTSDLPDLLHARVSSRIGFTAVPFAPYTYDQMNIILAARLDELKLFNKNSLLLLARKSCSVAGDVRAALRICQRAIEIHCEMLLSNKILNPVYNDAGTIEVDKKAVISAANEYKCDPLIQACTIACPIDKALIVSCCIHFKSTGGEVTFNRMDIWMRFKDLIAKENRNHAAAINMCVTGNPLPKRKLELSEPEWAVFNVAIDRLISQGIMVSTVKYTAGVAGTGRLRQETIHLRVEIIQVMAAFRNDPCFKEYVN